jgi:hypothetical protein
MKSKTQIINLSYTKNRDINPVLFCPFTGTQLIYEDLENGFETENYPPSVLAVWAGEPLEFSEPLYCAPEFNLDFNKVGAIEDIAKSIDKAFPKNNFLILCVKIYGNHPGDFGISIFLLKYV